jgi:hypothetical protein
MGDQKRRRDAIFGEHRRRAGDHPGPQTRDFLVAVGPQADQGGGEIGHGFSIKKAAMWRLGDYSQCGC